MIPDGVTPLPPARRSSKYSSKWLRRPAADRARSVPHRVCSWHPHLAEVRRDFKTAGRFQHGMRVHLVIDAGLCGVTAIHLLVINLYLLRLPLLHFVKICTLTPISGGYLTMRFPFALCSSCRTAHHEAPS
jgi:Flp pilus assembly protein TadB